MATYSRGICALSAHACVRAHVIMARIIMAYLVTANKVAAYIVTTKYSYGLYTPCERTRARIRAHAHARACSYGLYMHGLHSYGLYRYGLCSCSLRCASDVPGVPG